MPGVFYYYRKGLVVKKIFLLLVSTIFLLSGQICSYAVEEERETLIDVLMKPIKIILAPVKGGELIDLVTKPAEELLFPVFELNGEVVTPLGVKERAIDYPGNVSVITEKDIEESNAKYVYELLRKEAGIYVTDYTHAGKTVTVDMRGFGESASRNVLVMLDGRRLNEIDISGVDWAQIPLENVERIEILRGGGSVLYGDNATAGVINILTKRGKKGHHIKGGIDFGSYRYRNYYGAINGAEEFASYNAFLKHEKTDGYRLNGDYDGYDFMAAMTIFPADCLNVDFSGGYHKDWYGLPSGLQRWEIDQIGYRGSTTPDDRVKTETTFLQIRPTVIWSMDSMDHILDLDCWGRKKRVNMINWAQATWLAAMPWYPSWDTSQIDSVGGSIKYKNIFHGDSITNVLTLGVDMVSASNRLLTVTPQLGTLNQLKIDKRTLGIYISNNIVLYDKFIINGGFREEWAMFDFDQNRGAGFVTGAGLMEYKSPKQEAFDVGIEYKYREEGGVYGRFSRSFRFQATDEFYSRWVGLNTDLKHQTADTWEVGIKDEGLDYFQPSVNVFWMETDDEIYFDPKQGTVGIGDNRNYDAISRFGVEMGTVSEIGKWGDAYLNYTYLNADFEKGQFCGNKVPMVPQHKIAWGVNLFFMKFLEMNFNSEYITEQYSINDQENHMPKLKSHFVCNAKITAKYKGLKLFFGVNNMFDERYSEIAVSNANNTVTDFFPAPDRNYVFGTSWEF